MAAEVMTFGQQARICQVARRSLVAELWATELCPITRRRLIARSITRSVTRSVTGSIVRLVTSLLAESIGKFIIGAFKRRSTC